MQSPEIPAPEHLKAEGLELYLRVRGDFVLDDAASLAVLEAACEALDRANEARQVVAKEGFTILGPRGSLQEHPALRTERQSRAAMVSALKALDVLDTGKPDKPKRPVGRPPNSGIAGRAGR